MHKSPAACAKGAIKESAIFRTWSELLQKCFMAFIDSWRPTWHTDIPSDKGLPSSAARAAPSEKAIFAATKACCVDCPKTKNKLPISCRNDQAILQMHLIRLLTEVPK